MSFRLHVRNEAGERQVLLCDQHTSALTHEDGREVLPAPEASKSWPHVFRVSPETPAGKISDVRRLKIQLGLACNMACSYCLQTAEIHKAAASSTRDAEIFLAQLDTWLTSEPQRIEFWGGEPLLYWHKLERLIPALRERFPKAHLLLISNGTLLDDDKADKLWDWGISLGISHDGPGQHVRGVDPFDGPNGEALQRTLRRFGQAGRCGINAVLSPASSDADAVIDWLRTRLGWDVPVGFEGVVHDYTGHASAAFTPEQLATLTRTLSLQLINGTALRSHSLAERVERLMRSFVERRPSHALGQKCGMDRDDSIAVDLLGNVTTCQNTGAKGRHRIGHVRSLDKVQLTTAYHWSHREECRTCPVLQSCAGACMYQTGAEWDNSCNAEFAYNMAIFAGALFHLTGFVLSRIEGHMVRPEPVRPAPARAAAAA